ncbi:hypothetical protein [Wolbachia endosymbiont of Folsomia candida]|uniref:hypothetical protein n=1 Tax=Wolbachia endosymbiont of Folsomia candida TaxID=169402 RepID=UPI000B187588|nr:hypothetical protein [Wolbachia endosymbiont of Folsomia candida]APR98724.1 hypothetical protein ASM33_05790 [Wolbachia endosymbiont of Folsomia candida]
METRKFEVLITNSNLSECSKNNILQEHNDTPTFKDEDKKSLELAKTILDSWYDIKNKSIAIRNIIYFNKVEESKYIEKLKERLSVVQYLINIPNIKHIGLDERFNCETVIRIAGDLSEEGVTECSLEKVRANMILTSLLIEHGIINPTSVAHVKRQRCNSTVELKEYLLNNEMVIEDITKDVGTMQKLLKNETFINSMIENPELAKKLLKNEIFINSIIENPELIKELSKNEHFIKVILKTKNLSFLKAKNLSALEIKNLSTLEIKSLSVLSKLLSGLLSKLLRNEDFIMEISEVLRSGTQKERKEVLDYVVNILESADLEEAAYTLCNFELSIPTTSNDNIKKLWTKSFKAMLVSALDILQSRVNNVIKEHQQQRVEAEALPQEKPKVEQPQQKPVVQEAQQEQEKQPKKSPAEVLPQKKPEIKSPKQKINQDLDNEILASVRELFHETEQSKAPIEEKKQPEPEVKKPQHEPVVGVEGTSRPTIESHVENPKPEEVLSDGVISLDGADEKTTQSVTEDSEQPKPEASTLPRPTVDKEDPKHKSNSNYSYIGVCGTAGLCIGFVIGCVTAYFLGAASLAPMITITVFTAAAVAGMLVGAVFGAGIGYCVSRCFDNPNVEEHKQLLILS